MVKGSENILVQKHNGIAMDIELIDFPGNSCVGVCIHSTIQQAHNDCPTLWEQFIPRMPEISGKPWPAYQGESFGVSVMSPAAPDTFTYWALMPFPHTGTVPVGMQRFVTPPGKYACCTAPSLQKLGEIYMYLYGKWPEEQGLWQIDCQRPCFEKYDASFMENGSLSVYVPVKSKELRE